MENGTRLRPDTDVDRLDNRALPHIPTHTHTDINTITSCSAKVIEMTHKQKRPNERISNDRTQFKHEKLHANTTKKFFQLNKVHNKLSKILSR